MRQVGDIKSRKEAARFASFLVGQKIVVELRDQGDDLYRVWVINEDHLRRAEELYAEYCEHPQSTKFDSGMHRALFESDATTGSASAPMTSRPPTRQPPAKDRFEIISMNQGRTIPVTVALIILSIVLTGLASLSQTAFIQYWLLFSTQEFTRSFPEIRAGEVWRLLTPIFLHKGIWHILFNMLWLFQLGGAIETQEKSRFLSLFILVTALVCNVTQYMVAGPLFVGMSGIVYALLGYIWCMQRYQAASGYFIHPQTMLFMMIWLVVCLVGIIPNVANAQHVTGLIVGVVWGFFRSGQLKTMRRQKQFKRR